MLQAVVLAYVHAAHRQHHLLSYAICVEHVGVAYRQRQGTGFVLYVQVVVYVARFVGTDDAGSYVEAVAVFGKAYCVDIIAVGIPILRFEVFDGDVGFDIGMRYDHGWSIEIVGAACDARGGQRQHRSEI